MPADAPSPFVALITAANEAAWLPLARDLAAVEQLHLVQGPALRGLPLQSSSPIERTGCYAALPGFLRVFEATRAFRDEPRPSMQALDVGIDCAWSTLSPIPFVQAEAEMLRAGGGSVVRVESGLQTLERLGKGDHALTVQLACHGTTAGADADRFAVLLVDAESGARLDPRGLLAQPGTIDEFVCSTCVGGVVSQSVGVDAMGIASAMQLKGARSVIACLAPVSDFHMPLLMSLVRYHRRGGRVAAVALAQARNDLIAGDWPDEITRQAPAAYAEVMQQVLLRAQYAGLPTGDPLAAADRACRLANSVGGWVLPYALLAPFARQHHLSGEMHRAFSESWCESPEARARFAGAAAEHLVRTRGRWPARHRLLVEHLCTFTQCFGGLGA